jgi:hypothetical protein
VGPDYDCTRTCTHRFLLALGAVSENGTLALDLVIARIVREMRSGAVPLLVMDCCSYSIPDGLVHWFRGIFYAWHSHGKGPADGRFGATPP